MKSHENKQSTPELSRKQKLARRFLPVLALSLAAGGYAGNKLHEKTEYHEIDHEQTSIGQDETPIGAVTDAVKDLAEENGFHLNDVSGIVTEGQEVGHKITVHTDSDKIQPGTPIEVTVLKNGFGRYKVEADPVEQEQE